MHQKNSKEPSLDYNKQSINALTINYEVQNEIVLYVYCNCSWTCIISLIMSMHCQLPVLLSK